VVRRRRVSAKIGTSLALAVLVAIGCARAKPARTIILPTLLVELPTDRAPTFPPDSDDRALTPADTPTVALTLPTLSESATPGPDIPTATATLAPAPEQQTVTPTPPTGTISHSEYAIARGDTLTSIALRHDTTVLAIMNVNGLVDPDDIHVGQILLIPCGDGDEGQVPTGQVEHTVAAGETLATLARLYRTTPEDILSANEAITDPLSIPVGITLTIPVGTAPQQVHIVRAGETLYSIARRYGVEIDTLVALNAISSPNHVEAGQVLILP